MKDGVVEVEQETEIRFRQVERRQKCAAERCWRDDEGQVFQSATLVN